MGSLDTVCTGLHCAYWIEWGPGDLLGVLKEGRVLVFDRDGEVEWVLSRPSREIAESEYGEARAEGGTTKGAAPR